MVHILSENLYLEQVVHMAMVHLAHLALLVHLEEMDWVPDQLMWASTLQNTFTVSHTIFYLSFPQKLRSNMTEFETELP